MDEFKNAKDKADFYEEDMTHRIGQRIKHIRNAKNISQAELAEKLDLPLDRLQKYENGYRKPRNKMIENIAKALGVSVLSIVDPVVTDKIGAMYGLFELESKFGLSIDCDVGKKVSIHFDNSNELFDYLTGWCTKNNTMTYIDIKDAETEAEKEKIMLDYENWKWNFPESHKKQYDGKKALAERKAEIQKKIEVLQSVYNILDEYDDEE